MKLIDLIKANRSYRGFKQDVRPTCAQLREFVECAEFSASAGNRQPLKFFLSCGEATNEAILEQVAVGALLKPERVLPYKGKEPTAYIVICVDSTISQNAAVDVGIAAQSILLAATEAGFGGCMIGAFRPEVKQALNLSENLNPALIIALGVPDEEIVLEYAENGVKYYRDEAEVHHVPKRSLEELIIKEQI